MMGIIHYVGCQYCQVYRNLDKLYIPVIRNRQDVITATAEFVSGEKSAFRYVLLAGFMRDHQEHPCVFFIDQRYDLLEQWEDDGGDWWDC